MKEMGGEGLGLGQRTEDREKMRHLFRIWMKDVNALSGLSHPHIIKYIGAGGVYYSRPAWHGKHAPRLARVSNYLCLHI